jgi:hypothetical protein
MNLPTLLLRIPDDTDSGTILDTPTWILKLGFPEDFASGLFRQCLEIDLQARKMMVVRDYHPKSDGVLLTKGVFPTAAVKPSTAVPSPLLPIRCRRVRKPVRKSESIVQEKTWGAKM